MQRFRLKLLYYAWFLRGKNPFALLSAPVRPFEESAPEGLPATIKKAHCFHSALYFLAERKGLEPSASGVTGRRYNRLNYRSGYGGQYRT